ncbi:MAG TPA: hypothetical protein VGA28_01165 [Desulfurivibrionaceae bacterium]
MDVTEAAGESTPSDAYWLHTFEMKPTMKVNDKISMSATIRLADDTFWGGQAGGDTAAGRGIGEAAGDVEVWQLYMDYASPIGKMRFGRTPAGPYGTAFNDPDLRRDRVMLWPSFLASGPFSTLFYIQKNTENTQVGTANDETDADSDTYTARLYYKTDSVDTGLNYSYMNDMTDDTLSNRKYDLTVYGKFKMDNFFLNGELTHFFGEKDWDAAATLDRDYDSWGGMLQVGAKLDALTPSLMYIYASGQDRNATAANGGDIESFLTANGTGDLFEPLYILTGRHTGMLNNDIFAVNTAMTTAGVHAVIAAADYAVSNQLKLHGAIGYAQADEAETATYTNRDDEYGWEYNIGAAYKLLDNLTYEAHFGYLDTGDFFKSTATTDDTENVYVLTHSLTMTF